VTHRLARHLNKRLDSVRFYYTLLVCMFGVFVCVHGNNQRMLCTKNIYFTYA